MEKIVLNSLFSLVLMTSLVIPQVDACQYNLFVVEMLAEMQQMRWVHWIEALSGERPVSTSEGDGKILTRSNLVMFEPDRAPDAFTFIVETLQDMGFKDNQDYEIHTYNFPYEERHPERNWKNLILTIHGTNPDLHQEKVLMVAHLDSISGKETVLAPGADDNATGSAGLLEAAAVLRHFQFDRTIHLVWFSGEEYSRVGSEHFVDDYAEWLPNIIGVVNLDMFGYDADDDRCFEVHAGTLTGSKGISDCLQDAINAYDLGLAFDLIDDETAYAFSDHFPFWEKDVPAVMIYENGFFQAEKTCGKTDRNPKYHTIADLLTYINQDTGFSILQAALATTAHLAEPNGRCFSEAPKIRELLTSDRRLVIWDSLPEADLYQVWLPQDGDWTLAGETKNTYWVLSTGEGRGKGIYKVIAMTNAGCQSVPGSYPTK
jgi:leucyl aminopeptidase